MGEALEQLSVRQMTKIKTKEGNSGSTKKEQRTVQFVTLMDICRLKNVELEPKYQKYKDRVVLRGDIVKDDSDSY